MKDSETVTFEVPGKLKERLEKEAENRMTSQSAILRQSLDKECGQVEGGS